MDKVKLNITESTSASLKHFVNNAVLFGAGNTLLRGASFLLVPLYAYHLSVSEYGTLETAFVTIQILVIFMGVGMPSTIIRFYAQDKKQNDIGHLLGSSLGVIGIAMFLCSLPILFLPSFVFSKMLEIQTPSFFKILIAITALAECSTIYAMSILRAQDKAGKYTLMAFCNAVFLILFTLLLLTVLNQGLYGALIARGLAYGSVGTLLTVVFLQLKSKRFSISKALELLRFGFPLTFVASAWFIMLASDRYFLAHFSGMHQVGIYSLGYRLTFLLLILVVVPFELTYGPFVFKNMDHLNMKKMMSCLFTYLMLALILVGFLIVLLSRDIISLIAPNEYKTAYLVTICILPTTALQGIHYWSNAQLHITKKTSTIALVLGAAAFLNLVLNYLLIPKFAWVGAVVATNISSLFAVSILFVIGLAAFPVPLELRRLGLLMAVAAALVFSYLITNTIRTQYFYIANIGVLLTIPFFLYFMHFFDSKEKNFLKNLLTFKKRQ